MLRRIHSGMRRGKVILDAARAHPDFHQQYLRAINHGE
ncbi:hypothetical protein D779_3917 [Imhoffiella purpurea]|uniref:Uncharacterized protein n=1 Tax=Imhoffiella purpurea TaxID=1249627 RepID=W9V1L8_9GAMM|nr:hypothetical protein D779_3917 [Imhoffiella purpurea]